MLKTISGKYFILICDHRNDHHAPHDHRDGDLARYQCFLGIIIPNFFKYLNLEPTCSHFFEAFMKDFV